MKTLSIFLAGLLAGCQSLWGTLSTPNPDNCVSNPSLCLADEVCDAQEQICHSALALYAVTPNLAPTSGGGYVKLLGERFLPGIQVYFAGQQIADVSRPSSTEMAFLLPASLDGAWWTPISLQNVTGNRAQRSDLFSYYSENVAFSASRIDLVPNPRAFATGDWNGDGKLDLAYSIATDIVIGLALGKGDGSLETPKYTQISNAQQSAQDVLAIDCNNDQKLDLLIAVDDGVKALLGDGKGGFVAGATVKTGLRPQHLALLRQAGSEIPTLAVQGNDPLLTGLPGPLSIVALRPDGTFSTPKQIATSTHWYALAAGDISGDGTSELFGSDNGGLIQVFSRNPAGDYVQSSTIPLSTCVAQGLTVSDLDHDGWQDLVLTCNSSLMVLRNRSGTLDGTPTLLKNGIKLSHDSLAVDLTGDGWPDLVYGEGGPGPGLPAVFLLQADRKGGYLPPFLLEQPISALFANPPAFASADFDGDHKPDLAIGFPSAKTAVLVLRNQSP